MWSRRAEGSSSPVAAHPRCTPPAAADTHQTPSIPPPTYAEHTCARMHTHTHITSADRGRFHLRSQTDGSRKERWGATLCRPSLPHPRQRLISAGPTFLVNLLKKNLPVNCQPCSRPKTSNYKGGRIPPASAPPLTSPPRGRALALGSGGGGHPWEAGPRGNGSMDREGGETPNGHGTRVWWQSVSDGFRR